MKKFYRVNGVAFSDNVLAWRYVDTYLMGDEKRYEPTEEEGDEKIYSSLEEYEKDNPEACIARLRTERFFFKKEENLPIDLPFIICYREGEDIGNYYTRKMTVADLYQLTRCAEMAKEGRNIDKNSEFVVPVQIGEERRKYTLTVGQVTKLEKLVEENLSKLSKINEKIQIAIEKFGIHDENLEKENAQYQRFQKQYVKKIKNSFDEKQYFVQDERDALLNEIAGDL